MSDTSLGARWHSFLGGARADVPAAGAQTSPPLGVSPPMGSSGHGAEVRSAGTFRAPHPATRDVYARGAQGVPLYRSANTNATTSAWKYKEPHERTLEQYTTALTFDPRRLLQPGDVVIDSGGGAGIAALALAARYGAHAIVLNTQDFFQPIRDGLRALASGRPGLVQLEHSGGGYATVKSIGGIDPEKLVSLAEAAGADVSGLRRAQSLGAADVQGLEAAARGAAVKILETVDAGRFQYERGYAEELLPRFPKQAKLITDFWGAFGYSPERHRVLEAMYSALATGGEAYVLVHPKASTDVRTGYNTVDLVDYLTRKHPTVFSSRACPSPRLPNARVLIMRRDPAIDVLSLGLELEQARPRKGQFSTPRLVLVERAA